MGVTDPLGFNIYLRSLRKNRGWSLRDVEKLTDGRVSNAYLSQLESGRSTPSIVVVHMLAVAYGVSFEDLCHRALVGNEPLPFVQCCPACGRPYT